MKINNLVEMAIPVSQGPKVWKEINDLLKQDKYKEAAKVFIDAGGTARGAKRTWNVAQANTKISGGKVAGPIYGLIDPEHDYDKFASSMPAEEQAPRKNKERNKEPESVGDVSLSYKTLADKRKAQELSVKDGTAAGADLARKMGKRGDRDPVKTLASDAERLGTAAKDIKRYNELEKKDKSGAKMSIKERGELSKLKKSTLEYRTKKGVSNQAIQDFKEAKTIDEIRNTLNKHIEKKTRIDDRDTVVDLLNKIRKTSSGKEAVDVHLLLKRIFRNKNNKASIDNLVAKYETEVEIGQAHLKKVDSVMNKYNKGTDVSKADLSALSKELSKMLPIMKDNKKYDLKGFSTYTETTKKINDFLKKGEEPTADEVEELLDGMSKYQESIKPKRSLKEDILYNLKQLTIKE